MLKIAITGGVASGKTEALNFIKSKGFEVISSDNIVSELLLNNQNVISIINETFPGVVQNGVVNKKFLGRIIFNSNSDKLKLENILHPIVKIVRDAFFNKVQNAGNKVAFCEIPLLFEKNLQVEFDYSILITCSLEQRVTRFIHRTGDIQEKFFDIAKNQMPDAHKVKLANFVVKNEKSIDNFQNNLINIINNILNKQDH